MNGKPCDGPKTDPRATKGVCKIRRDQELEKGSTTQSATVTTQSWAYDDCDEGRWFALFHQERCTQMNVSGSIRWSQGATRAHHSCVADYERIPSNSNILLATADTAMQVTAKADLENKTTNGKCEDRISHIKCQVSPLISGETFTNWNTLLVFIGLSQM